MPIVYVEKLPLQLKISPFNASVLESEVGNSPIVFNKTFILYLIFNIKISIFSNNYCCYFWVLKFWNLCQLPLWNLDRYQNHKRKHLKGLNARITVSLQPWYRPLNNSVIIKSKQLNNVVSVRIQLFYLVFSYVAVTE